VLQGALRAAVLCTHTSIAATLWPLMLRFLLMLDWLFTVYCFNSGGILMRALGVAAGMVLIGCWIFVYNKEPLRRQARDQYFQLMMASTPMPHRILNACEKISSSFAKFAEAQVLPIRQHIAVCGDLPLAILKLVFLMVFGFQPFVLFTLAVSLANLLLVVSVRALFPRLIAARDIVVELEEPDPKVRVAATAALKRLGEERLQELSDEEDEDAVASKVLPSAYLSALARLLVPGVEGNCVVRMGACNALSVLDVEGLYTYLLLQTAEADESKWTRIFACLVLARLAHEHAQPCKSVLERIAAVDQDGDVRKVAAHVLECLNGVAVASVLSLAEQALHDLEDYGQSSEGCRVQEETYKVYNDISSLAKQARTAATSRQAVQATASAVGAVTAGVVLVGTAGAAAAPLLGAAAVAQVTAAVGVAGAVGLVASGVSIVNGLSKLAEPN